MKINLIVLIASIYMNHCLGSLDGSSERRSIPGLDTKGWLGPNWYGWHSEGNILLNEGNSIEKLVKTSSETDDNSTCTIEIDNKKTPEYEVSANDSTGYINKKRRKN